MLLWVVKCHEMKKSAYVTSAKNFWEVVDDCYAEGVLVCIHVLDKWWRCGWMCAHKLRRRLCCCKRSEGRVWKLFKRVNYFGLLNVCRRWSVGLHSCKYGAFQRGFLRQMLKALFWDEFGGSLIILWCLTRICTNTCVEAFGEGGWWVWCNFSRAFVVMSYFFCPSYLHPGSLICMSDDARTLT